MLPKGPRAQPKARRKVLIFTRATGFRHDSIPYAVHALQLLGQVTGAYDAFISDELISFEPDVLHQLDAIVLCNTTGNWIQPNAEDVRKLSPDGAIDAKAVEIMLRQSLLDFVANGGGLVGIHSASDANYHWAEFGQLVGDYFDGHPWHEQVWMNVERPDHPLSAAFDSSEFSIVDEIYQFRDPYSRDHLQVLLSLDTDKTDMNKKGRLKRTDGDFAVAWTRHHGKGRVFYSSLGHRPGVFWNPTILQFYLDGIQFVLGDMREDAAHKNGRRLEQ